MSSDYSIPPLRELPPGRLTQRSQHLRAEITRTQRSRVKQPLALPRRRLPAMAGRRRAFPLALAAVTAVAVAAPALALSERARDFFGLTNRGEPIPAASLGLAQVRALERVGFAGEVNELGERNSIAFYAGRSASGGYCFSTGPAPAPKPEFGVLACQGRPGVDVFPSAQTPIADFSPLRGREGSNDVHVWKLVGFAADGVATVAVETVGGLTAHVAVSRNTYASAELPPVAAEAIVALDRDGKVIYREPLTSSSPG